MKKLTHLSAILLFIFILPFKSFAAPGDTTWVQANNVQLDWYNNFDQDVEFPDNSKTYRKILMYFTLGKYNCPSGSQYCHQWDYTVQNFVMKDGDTVEISRLITPFATSGWSRFEGNWKQPYIFDVTNYEPLLHDSATVRVHYSGYSGGFTADVKFAFIEGTPERDILGIDNVYSGSFQFGNTNNPINDNFSVKNLTTPVGTKSSDLKVLITGHGSDNGQCCEFLSNNYFVRLNDNQIATYTIWKDDCGVNQLYPQGGTWIYDRGNWCPGEAITPVYHNLTSVNDGEMDFDLQMQFSSYVGGGDYGSYITSATVFYYGEFNKELDASLEQIISPTTNPDYYRENPGNNSPEVLVRNSGATTITSLEFLYGVQDSTAQTYTWTGSLEPLQEIRIVLDELSALKEMSYQNLNGQFEFTAEIVKVNEVADEDDTNNALTSKFVVAPTLPATLIIDFKTSNIGANGFLNTNPADASWKVENSQGDVLYERINNEPSTEYKDTLSFNESGFYKLTITTLGCGGLNWWAFAQGWGGYSAGWFRLKKYNGENILMNNYKYNGLQRDDFGCEFVYYFSVSPEMLSLEGHDFEILPFDIYPNPTKDELNVVFENKDNSTNTVQLINTLGEVVYEVKTQGNNLQIPTTHLDVGVYSVIVSNTEGYSSKKVVVTK